MPADPRGRNAATALAVVLVVLLAFVWLRSSGHAAPPVPAGLAVPAPAAAPPERAAPSRLGQGGEARGRKAGRVPGRRQAGHGGRRR